MSKRSKDRPPAAGRTVRYNMDGPADIIAAVRRRKRWADWDEVNSVAKFQASLAPDVPRATFYKWWKKYRAAGVLRIEAKWRIVVDEDALAAMGDDR